MQAHTMSLPFDSDGAGAIETGVAWLASLATGNLALGLGVLAIGVIGLAMLSGRLSVRAGLRVVLGCFVLLGAPVIASSFVIAGQGGMGSYPGTQAPHSPEHPRAGLPPSAFDPYAGASLRED